MCCDTEQKVVRKDVLGGAEEAFELTLAVRNWGHEKMGLMFPFR